jgi:transposase
MAFREVTMLEIKEVLWRWLVGGSKKSIARQLGVARNTVRRYIEAAEACGLKAGGGVEALTDECLGAVLVRLRTTTASRERGDAWATCVARRSFIEQKLKDGLLLTKVHRLLKRNGVIVPYSTLHRFAKAELDFGAAGPSVPVADCEPGEELQLDTGWMTHLEPDITGKRRRFRAWIFTSVHTRHRFVFPVLRETTESAIDACEAAWRFFGGVFRVLIPDNTKAIVQEADPLKPLINQVFLEYAQARGFLIDTARVRHPKDKARVERTVPDVREDCFNGERLLSIPDALRRGEVWSRDEYGMRRHTRTQRMPLEHFNEAEKPKLLPAPSEPYDVPKWSDPKVGPDQFAVVQKALYSIDRAHRGKKLRARADSYTVRFYFKGELIATAPRQPAGKRYINPAHFPEDKLACAQRDTAFLRNKAASHGKAVGEFAAVLLDVPLPWTRMRLVYALLGLCKRYGDARVEEVCARALAAQMHDFHRLERMLKLGAPQAPSPERDRNKVVPLARYLRPSAQYALPLLRKGESNNKEGDNT